MWKNLYLIVGGVGWHTNFGAGWLNSLHEKGPLVLIKMSILYRVFKKMTSIEMGILKRWIRHYYNYYYKFSIIIQIQPYLVTLYNNYSL